MPEWDYVGAGAASCLLAMFCEISRREPFFKHLPGICKTLDSILEPLGDSSQLESAVHQGHRVEAAGLQSGDREG